MKALEAAKLACEHSGWSLSNLQLQKVLYIAHMLYAGRHNGKKLIEDGHFEAWDYGPVLPVIYRHVSAFGSRPVGNVFRRVPSEAKDDELQMIKDTVEHLAEMDPFKLVAIVHEPDSAWYKHYRPGDRHIVIPQSDIQEEYKKRFSSEPEEQATA